MSIQKPAGNIRFIGSLVYIQNFRPEILSIFYIFGKSGIVIVVQRQMSKTKFKQMSMLLSSIRPPLNPQATTSKANMITITNRVDLEQLCRYMEGKNIHVTHLKILL